MVDPKLQAKAEQIYELLVSEYGIPIRNHGPAFESLIHTILSANTNDVNSGRAFRELVDRFDGDWDAVRTAPLGEVKQAIRVAGMYNQKAPHIVKTLEMIHAERGAYDLDHVAEMPVADGLRYLSRFPGVGHKTASIVLLFCFGKGAFPVDTHVQRQSQRLGISDRKASAARVKADWESLLAPETYYALHVDLIRHGRQVCRARNPQCGECMLQDLCDYTNSQGEWEK